MTEKKFLSLGIETGRQLRELSREELVQICGKEASPTTRMPGGSNNRRPVVPNRPRKSVGKETTLASDLYAIEDMLPVIESLCEKVSRTLTANDRAAQTITLKVKFSDFQQITRSMTVEEPIQEAEAMYAIARELMDKVQFEGRPVLCSESMHRNYVISTNLRRMLRKWCS